MYPHHVFNLEPAGTFGMYPICYWRVSGGYIQPEPAMYSRCFRWFPGPLAPSVSPSCSSVSRFPHRATCAVPLCLIAITRSLLQGTTQDHLGYPRGSLRTSNFTILVLDSLANTLSPPDFLEESSSKSTRPYQYEQEASP